MYILENLACLKVSPIHFEKGIDDPPWVILLCCDMSRPVNYPDFDVWGVDEILEVNLKKNKF